MDWEVTFLHVYREGNKCADWLAKTGNSSQQDLIILDHYPSAIYQAYLGDAMVSQPKGFSCFFVAFSFSYK